MKLHNPTSKTIYALLGTDHGAYPVHINMPPGYTAEENLTPAQMMNFQEVEQELKDLGLIIKP